MLKLTLNARGIAFRHCGPYHPQTCGNVERFHQSQKNWLAKHWPARALRQTGDPARELPELLQHRPAALGTAPQHSSQAYLARPKARPTGLPLDDSHYRIRHDRIDTSGIVTLRHDSRLHHIGLGRRHARSDVLLHTSETGTSGS